jgi:hypothetical protein
MKLSLLRFIASFSANKTKLTKSNKVLVNRNYQKLKLFVPFILSLFVIKPALAEKSITDDVNIKVATFNVSMDATNYLVRGKIGTGVELINALKNDHQQIKNIAEIIQRSRPDILLLNEFDYIKDPKSGLEIFLQNYLAKSQQGAEPIDYPYYYYAPVNTGVSTPFDLNNDGIKTGNLGDSHGFGHFPGHFGMVLLSRYPIDKQQVRTFQNFLWKDMPDAITPEDPNTNQAWYDNQEWQALRLSSKSHWDVPVKVNGKIVHILASHPTPPYLMAKRTVTG